MKASLRFVLTLALMTAAFISSPEPAFSQGSFQTGFRCEGKFKNRLVSMDDLDVVLRLHNQFLKDAGWEPVRRTWDLESFWMNRDSPDRANLCEANLSDHDPFKMVFGGRFQLPGGDLDGVHLEEASLEYAELNKAELIGAHLNGANLNHADLCAAILNDADMKKATLADADLEAASLFEAHLSGANLPGANLKNAFLRDAQVPSGVNLRNATLESADLSGAVLTGAHLENSNLVRTNLSAADLSGANLTGAYLEQANFVDSNLDGVIFEPDSSSLLRIRGLADAKNLHLMIFTHLPTALVIVRKQFKEAGLHDQENQITFAIRHSEMQQRSRHGILERFLNCILFEKTCGYGMAPLHPLFLVGALWAILSIFYVYAQLTPGPGAGIWAVWDEHRIEQSEGSKDPEQLTYGFPSSSCDVSFIGLALYFSLLSATRIGWRELNVGTWITRIQPREYTLRATGWVRVVSGVQSPISVYLVALSILTYFGTPFE